ncbi:MAG TPA: GAF domain-containing SpoIIE family protein phosphatase [Candidatus Koribacter sp.]
MPQAAGAARQKDILQSFATAIDYLTAPRSQNDLLMQITNLSVTQFGATRSELWLYDGVDNLNLASAAGTAAEHNLLRLTLADAPIGSAAAQRQPVTAKEPGSSLPFVSAHPLINSNQCLGVVVNCTADEASEEQKLLWQVFCDASAIALHQTFTIEDSQRTITQLSLLFEATRLLNSTLDLAELLELILKIARTELKADRGSVFLVDKKNQELWSIVASGLEHQEIRIPFGRGVAGRVAETGEIINVSDAYTLPFFDRTFDQKFGYTTKSLLCLPIRHHNNEIVGVLQLLNQGTHGRFTSEDQEFLTKLTGHMAMALENARLHREAIEKQRMERDLAVARNIQRSLLPDAPPVVPGYDIAVINNMCYEVGGDYYDFLNLGPQTLLLVVADVEGKGVSSALVMSNLQATLRALVMHLHSLEVLAISLNEMIFNDTKSEKFLSIFLGLVDIRRGGLHYINAGHVPPILVKGATGEYKLLEEGGTVIGLFPDAEYNRGAAKLDPGDVMVCCTDGILEASNTDDDEYGTERLAAAVAKHRTQSAQAIVDAVLVEVNAFSVGGKNIDDKVLMVIKVTTDGKFQQAIFASESETERAPQPETKEPVLPRHR